MNSGKISSSSFTGNTSEQLKQVKITRIPNGVYVWTETVYWGHAFILVVKENLIIAYTYGGYTSDTSLGVLIRYKNKEAMEYMRKALYLVNSSVYKINDINFDNVTKFFDPIWNNSNNIPPKGGTAYIESAGKIIDEYKIFSRNCTTITCDALKAAGSKIFDLPDFKNYCPRINAIDYGEPFCLIADPSDGYIDPEDLEDYLNYLCLINKNKPNKLVEKMTNLFRLRVPNIDGYKKKFSLW